MPTYGLLARSPYRELVPWDKTHVFWGDERCVPKDDPKNNAAAAFDALLDHVPIPADQIHRILSDASPQEAAQQYDGLLRDLFRNQQPRFDLIFLGLGEDGHTASLFPGSPVLDEQEQWVKEACLPEQNMFRVTLTLVVINQAARIAFLVQGRDKAKILREILAGPGSHGQLPAQRIRPVHGELIWLIDEEAARDLKL
jgi:6-phosphogluconolactonase